MADASAPIVRITGLGKRYDIAPEDEGKGRGLARALKRVFGRDGGDRKKRMLWALRDFNLEIKAGTVTGVIGRNGAGKTTLLRVLGRITAPTEGRAEGRGRIFPMLEVGASFHADFTARENVYFNAAMFGVPRDEVRRNFDRIVEFAGIGERIDDRVRDMSSGLYVRLAFSLAVTMRPDLLLADEVLAVGDAAFQESCINRIRKEKKRGMSVLFVSHDMAAVASICDRVVWIENGRIRKIGPPAEVIASYEHDLWKGKNNQVGDVDSEVSPVRLRASRALGATGAELAQIGQEDALKIELIFETRESAVTVTPGVDIFVGPTLLTSAWAETPTLLSAPGVYSAVMDIPPWAFTAREFRFRCAVRAEPASGAACVVESAKTQSFRVYGTDRPDPDGKQHKRARAGYVAPQLQWRLRESPCDAIEPERAAEA
ncbi:MAG: ABC transporter ATP-binding protein [Parvularculaceae bacterium]